MMERLKHVKDVLLCEVESQLGDLKCVDAKELGEVVDMVKDMEEAMYYCSITKAMKEREEEEEHTRYIPVYMPYDYRSMDRDHGRMYFDDRRIKKRDERWKDRGREEDYYRDIDREDEYEGPERERYPKEMMRDVREGKSPMSRKNYMESKELHQGVPAQMKELEKYLQELSQDITEMIADASQEEKTVLQQKLSILASKIK